MQLMNKLSRLGLILIGIQLALVALIPVMTQFYKWSCDFFCAFSDSVFYFHLVNFPGWLLVSTPINNIVRELRPEKISGNLYITDYVFLFVTSSITYYLLGWVMESLYHRIRKS